MDEQATISPKERLVVAAVAVVVMVLAMLRPTPELRVGDGVNEVPVGATAFSGVAEGPR